MFACFSFFLLRRFLIPKFEKKNHLCLPGTYSEFQMCAKGFLAIFIRNSGHCCTSCACLALSRLPACIHNSIRTPDMKQESRSGAVARALAYKQFGADLTPGPRGTSGLLVLVLALSVFLRVLRFSGSPVLPPQKPKFLNSYSIGNSSATVYHSKDCYVLPLLNKAQCYLKSLWS